MAAPAIGASRQPTLAEEIDEIERAEVVTTALQAVEQHSMTQGTSPKGRKPRNDTGVPNTPQRAPKKGKTPSPVRIDPDGQAWELEDDDQVQEVQGLASGLLVLRTRLREIRKQSHWQRL